MIRVLFFGRLRELAGTEELALEVPPAVATVGALRAHLAAQDPRWAAAVEAPGTRVACDQRFVEDAAPLAGAREIAFMAPLSGG